jgi:protein transport protein SEC61 subunit gamma and related proteins
MKRPKFNFSFTQYKRVWRLLRKPSKEEFLTISKVSAVGLLIIGAIGFLIAMAMGMFGIF